MADTHRVPHIEDLANGKEPFITAATAARRYGVHYAQILLAIRHGQIEGVEFLCKERGKGMVALIPRTTMATWAESYKAHEEEVKQRRADREAAKAERRASHPRSKAEHMAMMRSALARKRAKAKGHIVTISAERIAEFAAEQEAEKAAGVAAVDASLQSLSKREVYAILAALERLAQVHAERAEKDK